MPKSSRFDALALFLILVMSFAAEATASRHAQADARTTQADAHNTRADAAALARVSSR